MKNQNSLPSFKLEAGIPIPPIAMPEGLNRKYPFPDMKINTSFFVPSELYSKVYKACYWFTKTPKGLGKKFTFRTVKNGHRCWRVK